MTDTPKLNAVNYHVVYSPSTVCVPNMKTIAFCSTPKLNYPGLDILRYYLSPILPTDLLH